MTGHNAQDRGDLLTQARQALAANERTSALAAMVPDPADASRPRIALVGPHNAGKSLLLAAMLGMSHEQAERISAATPHTTEITVYPWREYDLLDLPGTLSGLDEHEHTSRQGVRRADALIIVTTVELPGDQEAAALRQLLDRDGFRGRCVLGVNKAASENNDLDIIRTELERRVGDTQGVLIVFTDARDHLDAINEPNLTDDDRDLLRADSGIADLETAIEAVFNQPEPPRHLAQLHEAVRVLDDGLAMWQPTVEEEIVETTAARARAAIDSARADATETVNQALATLGDSIRATGTDLATAVDAKTGALTQEDVDTAAAAEEQALRKFDAVVNDGVAVAVERLARDLGDALQQQETYAHKLQTLHTKVPTDKVQPSKPDRIVEALQQRITEAGSRRLTRLIEGGTRPGAPLHDLARKFNRARGVRAVANTHIHTAERFSKGLGATNFAFEVVGPALDLRSVVDDAMLGHRISKRRDHIRKEYGKRADALVAQERKRTHAHLDEQINRYTDLVSEQLEDAAEWRTTRDAACERLQATRQELAKATGLA